MERYHEAIRVYLDQNRPSYGAAEIHSLLEMLCRCYMELNPISRESVREHLGDLQRVLKKLPQEEEDALFSAVCALCGETERLAFREGLHLGLRLTSEIENMK